MKYIILTLFFTFKLSYSQIEKVNIKNSKLENKIFLYIDSIKSTYKNFEKYGFIDLKIKKISRNKIIVNITNRHNIPKVDDTFFYPQYYTYINGKLVFLYDNNFNFISLSKRKKKKYKKQIYKLCKDYFPKSTHLKVKNKNGNLIINDKKFIPQSYRIHDYTSIDFIINY